MAITRNDYKKLSDKASPNTKMQVTLPCAFVFGGLICTIAEGFKNTYIAFGLAHERASVCASISIMAIAALLTAIGIFDDFAKVARAGALMPIAGFANSMAAAALDFKSEGFVLGLGAKMFIIAGPVIVYGTVTSVLYGLVIYLFKLY